MNKTLAHSNNESVFYALFLGSEKINLEIGYSIKVVQREQIKMLYLFKGESFIIFFKKKVAN